MQVKTYFRYLKILTKITKHIFNSCMEAISFAQEIVTVVLLVAFIISLGLAGYFFIRYARFPLIKCERQSFFPAAV